MSRPWSEQWFLDCLKWRGIILEGRYRHWCPDWDELPIDETTPEFPCDCFRCKCGALLKPKYYPFGKPTLAMHDDIFECPKSRWWNFWKHTWMNRGLEG